MARSLAGDYPPPLPDSEVRELLRKYKRTADVSHRNKVVEHNMRLVIRIADRAVKVIPAGLQEQIFGDLVGEGAAIALRACELYDPDGPFKFSTYLYQSAHSRMMRWVAQNVGTVTVIPAFASQAHLTLRKWEAMEKRGELTPRRISTLRKTVALAEKARKMCHLSAIVGDHEHGEEVSGLPAPDTHVSPLDAMIREEELASLGSAMGRYRESNPLAAEVVERVYGLGVRERETAPAIAKSLGLRGKDSVYGRVDRARNHLFDLMVGANA